MLDEETKKMILVIIVAVACLLLILFAVRIGTLRSTDFSHFIRLNGERCELRTD